MDIDVSIIIVNYNTINWVINSIDSILEKTEGVTYEIIVIDNNSSDNAQYVLFAKYNDNVFFVSLPQNIGFGCANNEGIKIAKGRNVLFLNPDTKLINNAVKILSDYLDTFNDVGACGGNLYDEDMNPALSYKMFFPSIRLELNKLLGTLPGWLIYGKNTEHNYTNVSKGVAYITGADLMVKRLVLEDIGYFHSRFFMFFEDTELCYRIHKKKYKIISVPSAKIQHLEGKSFEDKLSRDKIRMYAISRITFYSLCYSPFYRKIASVISNLSVYLQLLLFSLKKGKKYLFWKIYKEESRSLYMDKYRC